ncbi:hypothetical protein, partial [Rhizobium sp. MHM7A]|uniref:hypothetical protein n=1 Tax=Rhizobium sp. MHM7A TaxID=2583233 RepID=UPI001FED7C8E
PLPNQQQQPKTAGANSKLDKTWGQGQVFRCIFLAGKGTAEPINQRPPRERQGNRSAGLEY